MSIDSYMLGHKILADNNIDNISSLYNLSYIYTYSVIEYSQNIANIYKEVSFF